MECKDFYKMNQRNEVSCVNLYSKRSVGESSIIQEKRILRLCKRLDKFTFDDISTIVDDVEESVLKLLLLNLVEEGMLSKQDDLYLYIKKKTICKPISTLKYFPPQIIDLVIRCFCADITSNNAQNLCDISETAMSRLYNYFRELIYENQKNELTVNFAKKPQRYRTRVFFENYIAYFYIYNNKIYITDKPLKGNDEKLFTSEEVKEFKKIYSYLTRIHCHNKNKVNIYHKLAEALWRREKNFEDLYSYLKLNISY